MNFQPLNDLLLVKPITTYNHGGRIFIPDTIEHRHSHKPGDWSDTFVGVVVATGPGDKLLHLKCGHCGHETKRLADRATLREKRGLHAFRACRCGKRDWAVIGESRMPMETKVGDKVVFARRPNTPGDIDGILIEGQRYLLFNEEQSALMVIAEEQALEDAIAA
jgi:co-chaperonin GroES (HSP10)